MQLKHLTHPQGFALIEALVAMLLAAVAVMALSAVHASALQSMRTSVHRVLALQLANDLAERLRANPLEARLGAGSAYQFAGGPTGADPAATVCEGLAAICSPADLARSDVAQWRQLLARALPAAVAQVQLDAARGLAEIRIGWQEPVGWDEIASRAGDCPQAPPAPGPGVQRCLALRIAW